MERPSLKTLTNIQVLRAFAALMIVVYHCSIETTRLAAGFGGQKLFDEAGWGSGVSLFFAISGFIMVVTTADQFGSWSAAVDFLRRRIYRIVPLYWLVTTCALAILVAAPGLMPKAGDHFYIAASYLFVPQLNLAGDVRPLATQGWTLNLEMLFYAVFAFALLLPRRAGLWLLFGTLGLLVVARCIGILPGVVLNFWGDPIVLGFLFGAVAGVAYIRGVRISRSLCLLLIVIGFAALSQPGEQTGAEDALYYRMSTVLPSALIVLAAALGPQVGQGSMLWWPFLAVGDASYSLYLVNPFLLRALSIAWKGPLAVAPLWFFLPAGLVLCAIAALMTYRYFEKPVTQRLNHPRAARTAAPPLPRPSRA